MHFWLQLASPVLRGDKSWVLQPVLSPLAEEKELSEQGRGRGAAKAVGTEQDKANCGAGVVPRAAALTQAELDWLSWLSMTMEVQP